MDKLTMRRWFAWYPVKLTPLSNGRSLGWVWLCWVDRLIWGEKHHMRYYFRIVNK